MTLAREKIFAQRGNEVHQNRVVSTGRASLCRSMTTLAVMGEKLDMIDNQGVTRQDETR